MGEEKVKHSYESVAGNGKVRLGITIRKYLISS